MRSQNSSSFKLKQIELIIVLNTTMTVKATKIFILIKIICSFLIFLLIVRLSMILYNHKWFNDEKTCTTEIL